MAVTHIHAITGKIDDAIGYAIKDKMESLEEFKNITRLQRAACVQR